MSESRPGHSFIRPQLRSQPNTGIFKVDPSLHPLQWNENPFDFPADLKEEVLQRLALRPWSRYPAGIRAFDVIDAVANAAGLQNNQVTVGNGSSDILRVVISAVLQSGDHMVTLTPTFNSYANHARQAGAGVHTVTLRPDLDFALPVEEVLALARETNAKLIVICAPNNPTGTIYAVEDLRKILLESDALVFFDAAYAEFCGQDLRPFLEESDRVVIAHTLSKAYALAGVRIGYAYSSPEIAQELQKLVINFTMSPFTESAAIIALENSERFIPLIEAIVAERIRLATNLSALPGVKVHSSGTNFLFIHIAKPAKDAQMHLRKHQQVMVSDMGMYPGYEEYLRISVGLPEQNDLVVEGLARFLRGA